MQKAFCPGFTNVKYSCGILLKSPWNRSYLTSSEGCARFLLSQALSRGIGKQQGRAEQLGTFPKRRGDGKMFENEFDCVWSVAVAQSQIGMLCESEKMALSPSKADSKFDFFGLRNELGSSFPWKSPTYLWAAARSERVDIFSDQSATHSGSYFLLSLPRAVFVFSFREWIDPGTGPRVVPMTAERAFNSNRWAGTTIRRTMKVTDLTHRFSGASHGLVSPLFFLFAVFFFFSPFLTCKIGLYPFMSELFPNDLGAAWRHHSGGMVLNWKQCAAHRLNMAHMMSV